MFQCYVIDSLHRLGSTIPIDVALQGVNISDAIVIDINNSVRLIASTDCALDEIDFGALYDVAPPIEANNFFIQFHSRWIKKDKLEPGWIGVHCVDFKLAQQSILFSHFPYIPEKLLSFPKVYSFLIYRQCAMGLSTTQAGILLGIEPGGKVSEPGFFPLLLQRPSNDDHWNQIKGHDAWIIYLVLSSFGLVNQKEAALRFTGHIYKI